MLPELNTCVVTGANGFVGAALQACLQRHGWRVRAWTRQPRPGTDCVAFRLGQTIEPCSFKGVRALVHCAYDFDARTWSEIRAVNITGSERLLQAARQAGVEFIVVISTLSAFEGCRALYGKAKLQIEAAGRTAGAYLIRPGLIYGHSPGGMFGRQARQVGSSRFVPKLVGGTQKQYLLHADDLGNLVLGCLEGRVPRDNVPIAIAHDNPWELTDILTEIGAATGRRVQFVPVPWQLAWLGLKTLELAGLRPKFRSDSLLSMVYQAPNPSFGLVKSLGFHCRPFQVSPEMFAPHPVSSVAAGREQGRK